MKVLCITDHLTDKYMIFKNKFYECEEHHHITLNSGIIINFGTNFYKYFITKQELRNNNLNTLLDE